MGNEFWLSDLPLLLAGLLAALVVLAWDWRVTLPSLLLLQFAIGQLAAQRARVPSQWSGVFLWVLAACLAILLLSIQHANRVGMAGRGGTALFRLLLLALAAFLLTTLESENLLPRLDGGITLLLLWIGFCALFGLSSGGGALDNAAALLLWLMGTQVAVLAIAPAALVVVLLGMLFLLTTLACSYLLIAENIHLAEKEYPLTDVHFPAQPAPDAVGVSALRQWLSRGVAILQGNNQP